MKRVGVFGVVFAALLSVPCSAQMMHGGPGMGGRQRTMINLVSPADAPVQIRRGILAIAQHTSGYMMRTPGPQANQGPSPAVWFLLRLYGVSDDAGLVTSTGNRLLFDGRLSTASGGETDVTIDQEFALRDGAALVQATVPVPTLADSARILIDRVAVLDANGGTLAVPGVLIAPAVPVATPPATPSGGCADDSDCDDHDPDTRDVCMPMGCAHMPFGPGGGR